MKKKHIALGAVVIAGVAGAFALSQAALAYRGDSSQTGPNYSPERHAAMEQAFESNDYNTWKEQMNGRGRVTEVVNEQNFARFAQMRKLMLENKNDEANKIRTELGLGQGNGQGRGDGQGMRRGSNGANFVDKDGNGVCDNC